LTADKVSEKERVEEMTKRVIRGGVSKKNLNCDQTEKTNGVRRYAKWKRWRRFRKQSVGWGDHRLGGNQQAKTTSIEVKAVTQWKGSVG